MPCPVVTVGPAAYYLLPTYTDTQTYLAPRQREVKKKTYPRQVPTYTIRIRDRLRGLNRISCVNQYQTQNKKAGPYFPHLGQPHGTFLESPSPHRHSPLLPSVRQPCPTPTRGAGVRDRIRGHPWPRINNVFRIPYPVHHTRMYLPTYLPTCLGIDGRNITRTQQNIPYHATINTPFHNK